MPWEEFNPVMDNTWYESHSLVIVTMELPVLPGLKLALLNDPSEAAAVPRLAMTEKLLE